MNKSLKPGIVLGLVITVSFLVLLFIYVGIKLRIDEMKSTIVDLKGKIEILKNVQLQYTAEYQSLTAKEHIAKIATEALDMEFSPIPDGSIIVSKELIEKVKNQL